MALRIRNENPSALRPALNLEFPSRYRGAYGGRGSGKTQGFAKALVKVAVMVEVTKKWRGKFMRHARIICGREFQNSLAHSVFAEIVAAIYEMKVDYLFNIGRNFIRTKSGRVEILFYGFARNIDSVKSAKNVIILWIEEAEIVSEKSWRILVPSIRGHKSEIWATWNPEREDSATRKRMILDQPKNPCVVKVNWQDNPWFPPELEDERQRCLKVSPEVYDHIWEGDFYNIGEAQVFKGKFEIDRVPEPGDDDIIYYGADWGYVDPTVLVRCYVRDEVLYITHAEFRRGLELRDYAHFFDRVPDSRKWVIEADNSRPEIIEMLRAEGFDVRPADKHAKIGDKKAIESGIDYLRNFRKIVIDEDLSELQEEFRKYSYKIDDRTGNITPILVDEYNHGIDALRYAFSKAIRKLGRGAGIYG